MQMDRELAIQMLKTRGIDGRLSGYTDGYTELYDYCLQILENCDEDCISRKDAITILRTLIVPLYGYEMNNQAVNNAIVEIMQLSSVKLESKSGHWIENKWGEETCSECGYTHKAEGSNYCSECGARME